MCLGAVAGGVLGFLVQLSLLAFCWKIEPGQAGVPLGGPAIGIVFGGVLGWAQGNKEIQGVARLYATSLLTGIVLGALAGYFFYAPIMTAVDPLADDLFRGRVLAINQQAGVFWGTGCGAAIGVIFALVKNRSSQRGG
jgi:hypothetical protein